LLKHQGRRRATLLGAESGEEDYEPLTRRREPRRAHRNRFLYNAQKSTLCDTESDEDNKPLLSRSRKPRFSNKRNPQDSTFRGAKSGEEGDKPLSRPQGPRFLYKAPRYVAAPSGRALADQLAAMLKHGSRQTPQRQTRYSKSSSGPLVPTQVSGPPPAEGVPDQAESDPFKQLRRNCLIQPNDLQVHIFRTTPPILRSRNALLGSPVHPSNYESTGAQTLINAGSSFPNIKFASTNQSRLSICPLKAAGTVAICTKHALWTNMGCHHGSEWVNCLICSQSPWVHASKRR
jgi:hypothetical protein